MLVFVVNISSTRTLLAFVSRPPIFALTLSWHFVTCSIAMRAAWTICTEQSLPSRLASRANTWRFVAHAVTVRGAFPKAVSAVRAIIAGCRDSVLRNQYATKHILKHSYDEFRSIRIPLCKIYLCGNAYHLYRTVPSIPACKQDKHLTFCRKHRHNSSCNPTYSFYRTCHRRKLSK